MSGQTLKPRINEAVKEAMRARDKLRRGTIRLIQSEIKRIEVDEQTELDDERVLSLLDKMLKQRRDSLKQYREAGRDDLADREQAEIDIIQDFLPAQISPEALQQLVREAIERSGAESMKDMGKVMAILKPAVLGRTDMETVSQVVKQQLR